MTDTLSQDEVDTLVCIVDKGDFEPTSDSTPNDPQIATYDLENQESRVQRRIPALDLINKQFAHHFSNSLFNFLKKPADVSVDVIKIQTFSDYLQNIEAPSSLNIVHLLPLKGRALIVMEPQLVFTAVDNFFGGSGQLFNKAERSDFSPTETRIINLLMDLLFKDLQKAWKPVMDIDMEHIGSETNAQFAHILSPSELVAVSTFSVKLKGGSGNMNIVLPYSMIEPIKALLNAVTSDSNSIDKVWQEKLRKEVLRSEIPIKSLLIEKEMSIQEVANFQKGDIIPIDMPDIVTIQAENVAILKGNIGLSNGNYAIQVTDKLTQDSFES